ncbi:MAG TPA: gamma-glutamyltransferase family protein [Beijerinckiaceae bacterium]|nr:gamma-glutamyltransferase family protein [Beijerinckiaceae bacterium]
MTRDFHKPGRSAVYGTSAMIATSHPEASLTGIEILKKGGSVVDAAIAATALLGVIEPGMTGIGGDCFAIVAKPGAEPVTLNGSGRSAAGATIELANAKGVETIEDNSPLAVTVPGAVDAWVTLHRDYGRLDFAELMEPAARRAEEGYPVAPRIAFDWGRNAERLRRLPQTAAAFLPGGRAPQAGEIHRQPALAATLREIGRKGRAGFYEGAAVDDMVATLEGLGGPHTQDDFAAQTSDYEPPISSSFASHDILECPPNGQGAAALLLLKALEHWPALEGTNDEGERLHLFSQATRGAYFLRDRAITDPAAMPASVEDFLSERAVRFVRDFAGAPPQAKPSGAVPWETDTICLSVVDRDGMAVSFINSLFNAFGSTILAAKSGVMLHCRGTSFKIDQKHPNRLEPRKRPMHTIIPGMVVKDGRALMPFGVMGGQYQAAGHADFLGKLLRDGMELQSAVDSPRSFAYGPTVQVENGIDEAAVRHLEARGHAIERVVGPLGGAQAIWIDHDRGVLIGASDPRKDGCALGY